MLSWVQTAVGHAVRSVYAHGGDVVAVGSTLVALWAFEGAFSDDLNLHAAHCGVTVRGAITAVLEGGYCVY